MINLLLPGNRERSDVKSFGGSCFRKNDIFRGSLKI
jgi:hypothetical protein